LNFFDFSKPLKKPYDPEEAESTDPKRRKYIPIVRFRRPCWVINGENVDDVNKILDGFILATNILKSDIPKLFYKIHTKQKNEIKNVRVNCVWKYDGIRRIIDIINTATHFMNTG